MTACTAMTEDGISAGHLGTHGGTVSVRITAVGGEYDGGNVYLDTRRKMVWRVQPVSQ